MFRRILIANRGEIARRIARTARRLGIAYVAVHSDADGDAPHLEGAIETVRLGPAAAQESYLHSSRLVAAALGTGCDAVHPGYGFLSENAGFAGAVAGAGLTFIGPSPETIDAMGDKAAAKRIMAAAGVPTVPGSIEAADDAGRVAALCEEIGFPVLLKPVAGGGGKGMHVVENPAAVAEAAESAIRLATAIFGDGRLLVERFIRSPRHIEVQMCGDAHGNVVHLFERECSLQRNHQKILEEAPAPNLAEDVRQALLAAAVRGARAIGYRNVGTIEFIVAPDGSFHFIEANTRLQVEHPVTEEITGIDLVEWQLRVAAGERLPRLQPDIHRSGHAIECRVYAEDPETGFRPAPGRALHVAWPPHLRVEAGIDRGTTVPPHYDPMVAKLVAHGADRAQALAALTRGLADCHILGLTTNLGFLARLLAHPRVVRGDTDTGLIDEAGPTLAAPVSPEHAAACAAACAVAPAEPGLSPWRLPAVVGAFDRHHLDPAAPLGRLTWRAGTRRVTARLLERRHETLRVAVEGDEDGEGRSPQVVAVTARQGPDGIWTGQLDGHSWCALAVPGALEVLLAGRRVRLETGQDASRSAEADGDSVVAPMPGVVVDVRVAPGDRVRRGDVLLLVEAMKMENRVVAPSERTVAEVRCTVGGTVTGGEVVVVFASDEGPLGLRNDRSAADADWPA